MRVIFIIAVIVVALVVSVYAYWAALPPPAGPRATITSYPLEFSIELSKTEYQFGENITITFQIKNISNETVTLTKLYHWGISNYSMIMITEANGAKTPNYERLISVLFHFGLSLTDHNGTIVFIQTTGIAPATYDILLEPNGYVKQTVMGNYVFNGLEPFSYLPRGTYQIRGIQQYCVILGIGDISLETPSITFIVK